jgi:hypothetical protein
MRPVSSASSPLVTRDGRIDRHDDPRKLRHGADARGLDDAVVPQVPRYIFKQFGV